VKVHEPDKHGDELLNHASVFQFKRVRVERYRAPTYGVSLDGNRPFTYKWRVIRLVDES
jgi:hypothetical protein